MTRHVWIAATVFALLLAACGPVDPAGPTATLPLVATTAAPIPTTATPAATEPAATAASADATTAPSAIAHADETVGSPVGTAAASEIAHADVTVGSPVLTPEPAATATQPPPPPDAASIDPAAYQLERVAGGFVRPLLATHSGVAGDERLFVVEQRGIVHIVLRGAVFPDPFLDITRLVNTQANERGLLGLAFHPGYADNGRFFVHYSGSGGETVVARYALSDDSNRADPASAQILLQVNQPYPNHNGGQMAFGPDGYLYVGLGDGGSGGDPQGHGQNLQTLLGAILRLDVDDFSAATYTVPADNPFVGRDDARYEIWAYGLRNPWRFSFDRATGDMYIGDVGQNAVEEISFQPAGSAGGENYGWNYMEGSAVFRGQPPAGLELTGPAVDYPRAGGNCSVTGGHVYRGANLPALNGVYFYGDYCSGQIWSVVRHVNGGQWVSAPFIQSSLTISSFGEDIHGELYVLDHSGGALYQLVAR